MKQVLARIGLAFVILTGVAAPAMAQVEVGASLFNFAVVKPTNDPSVVLVGVPSGPVALFTPGVYVACPLASKLAIEGNFGVALISTDGDSAHFLNAGGQIDYIFKNFKTSSVYVFGGGGFVHATDGQSAGTASAGAGYRWISGERVDVRFVGRYTYISSEGGNMFDFGITIGGLFGKK